MSRFTVATTITVDDSRAEGDEAELFVEHLHDSFAGDRWGLDAVRVEIGPLTEEA